MSKQKTDFESLHKELGCYDCKFADQDEIGKGACCLRPEGVRSDKDGVCTVREPLKAGWKEQKMTERTEEYAKLEQEKADIEHLLFYDKMLRELTDTRDAISKEIAALEKEPLHNLALVSQRQAEIRLELAETWGAYEGKTFKCDAGTVTLRETRSFDIRSKKKLVEFLAKLDKVSEFIKTFEIAKLRKVKEAGLLDDDIARWDEHKNVTISLKAKPTVRKETETETEK